RYGLVAFGSSLDQIGVFGRSVHDAARVLSVISGRDPKDSTCEARDSLRLPTVPESLQGFVIGVPKEYFPPALAPAVRRACDRAIRLLKELGAAVREVSLPHTQYAVPTYYIIAPAEASSNLARYDGARYGPRFNGALDMRALYRSTRGEGFGPEVRRRILVGTYVLSSGYYDAYYRRAQQMRALIAQDFRNVFDRGVDLLFTPTTPTPAFKAGEKLADPVAMYLSDIFVVTANLAGLPAMSLPIGRIKGLPIGGQFIGQAFLEDEMIEAAYALERVVPATEDAGPGGRAGVGGAAGRRSSVSKRTSSCAPCRRCSAAAPPPSARRPTRTCARCAWGSPARCRCRTSRRSSSRCGRRSRSAAPCIPGACSPARTTSIPTSPRDTRSRSSSSRSRRTARCPTCRPIGGSSPRRSCASTWKRTPGSRCTTAFRRRPPST